MFSRSSKGSGKEVGSPAPAPRKSAKPAGPAAPSIVSADLTIVGDLESDGEIQVDGSVEGDVRTKTMLVGPTAVVTGEIVADAVRVHGTVNGQIKARSVSLATNARVIGDILHENLSIEKGAFLEGHCRRMPDPKEAAALEAKMAEAPVQIGGPAKAPAAKQAPPPPAPKVAAQGGKK